MFHRPADRPAPADRGAPRHTSAAYCALLSAVGAMLMAVLFVGPLLTRHRVVAALHLRTTLLAVSAESKGSTPSAPAPAEPTPSTWTEAQWRQALDEAALVPAGDAGASAANQQRRRDWARRVHVQVETTASGDTRLQIAVDAAEGTPAAALAAALSRLRAAAFRQQCDESWQARLEQARAARQQAAQHLAQTMARWHDALQQWLDHSTDVTPVALWQAHHAGDVEDARRIGLDTRESNFRESGDNRSAAGVAAAQSEEIAALRRDITRLQWQRQQLLSTMTEDHPQVQWIDRELVQRHARLQTLEAGAAGASDVGLPQVRQAPQPVNLPAASHSLHLPLGSAEAAAWSQQRHQLAELVQQYRDELAAAQREDRAAQALEQAAWQSYQQQAREPLVWHEPLVRHITLDGGRRVVLVVIATLLAAATGSAAWRLARRAADRFETADEARAALPIPLLAAIPAAGAAADGSALRRHVQRWTAGCETCIAACIAWVVILAACQSDFLHTLGADPLAALAQAAPRTLQWLV
jgi:hypothetical protein